MDTGSSVDVLQNSPDRPARPQLLGRRVGAVLVVLLLTLGALVAPVIGWLAGVVLLLRSPGWRRIDKAIGTAVGPITLGIPLLFRLLHPGTAATDCTGSGGGFCAPSFDPAWYQSASSIGTWLALAHLALGAYLLLRFRLDSANRPLYATKR